VSTDEEITSVRAALKRADAALDAAYWAFSRQKRGKPPAGELYDRRNELRRRLRELECAK
jgi:hypothetical protein